MGEVWAALEGTPAAEWVRNARWGYAAVNGAHVLGVALLVGAMVPLNLRRLGLFESVPQAALARATVPVAGIGLALALVTGFLMFSSRASEYASLTLFQVKVALVVFGALGAVALHLAYGWFMQRANRTRLAIHGAVSMAVWVSALGLGRLIAFAD